MQEYQLSQVIFLDFTDKHDQDHPPLSGRVLIGLIPRLPLMMKLLRDQHVPAFLGDIRFEHRIHILYALHAIHNNKLKYTLIQSLQLRASKEKHRTNPSVYNFISFPSFTPNTVC
jgi:hypothetical protein